MELSDDDKQTLQRALDNLTSANVIVQFLSNHFRDKYGLTPENEITPDGRIVGTPIRTLDGTEGLSEINSSHLR